MALLSSPSLISGAKGRKAEGESVSVVQATDSTLDVTGSLELTKGAGTIEQGRLFVTTAGTAIQLPSKVLKNSLLLQWHPSNTGRIYYGSSSVLNNLNSPYIDSSVAGVVIEVANMASIYLNADNNGDGVLWLAH